MYCSNCGKQLADDAKFCDACGAQIDPAAPAAGAGAASAGAPVQPPYPAVKENVLVTNFVKAIKGFYSKHTVRTVGQAAKSTGMEWILLTLISCLVYALALALNVKQLFDGAFGALSGVIVSAIYNFGIWFLYGLIIAVVSYFASSLLLFGAVKLVFKKEVAVQNVFNLVAVATLPLTTAYILNIILGFVWVPLIFVFSAAAFVATAVLLYVGMQKLDKFETSPFIAYVVVWIIVSLIVCIVVDVCLNAAAKSLMSNLLGEAMGSLGSLSGLL